MKVPISSEHLKHFDRLPRKDKLPFSEVAAVQTFKLMGWATATGGVYLLQTHSDSFGLRLIPYLLWILIVWDMTAKLPWEPEVERVEGKVYVSITRGWAIRLTLIGLLAGFVAWAVIFWLAPLISVYVLAKR